MTRVALDLMGGDHAPAAVVDGALLIAAVHDDVSALAPKGERDRLAEVAGCAGDQRRLAVESFTHAQDVRHLD